MDREYLVVSCLRCGESLTVSDPKGRAAVRAGKRAACPDCARVLRAGRRMVRQMAAASVQGKGAGSEVSSGTWVSMEESKQKDQPPEPIRRSKTLFILIPIAVFVVVGIIAAALLGRTSPAPTSPSPAAESASVREVRVFERPRNSYRKEWDSELQEIDRKLRDLEHQEELTGLADLLRTTRALHDSDEWRRRLDGRLEVVRGKIERIASERRDRAAAEKAAEAKKAPVPDPAVIVYLEEWKTCMVHATLRHYGTAKEELAKPGRPTHSPELRRQIAADVDDLNRLASFLADLAKEASRLPRGTSVTFDVRERDGTLRKVSGRVLRGGSDRVELLPAESKESVFVEFEDATAASLAEFARSRGLRTDERLRTLFCLLDGDEESARKGRSDQVADKYWAYAKDARSRIPAADATEAGRTARARELFHAAEREYRIAKHRGSASDKYRLLQDLADVPLVKANEARIISRSQPCREYALAAQDLRGLGTFDLSTARSPSCWRSGSDVEFSRGNGNFVEAEFYAFADEPYRCWVQIGGCCAESLTCFYQVSDLTASHPQQKGATVALEPASIYALPVNISGIPLKPSHLAHAPRNQPKTPSTWSWVEVPLAKWTKPGIKRVRILSVQQGFAVARVIISATRSAAPSMDELKDLDESGLSMPADGSGATKPEPDRKKPPAKRGEGESEASAPDKKPVSKKGEEVKKVKAEED